MGSSKDAKGKFTIPSNPAFINDTALLSNIPKIADNQGNKKNNKATVNTTPARGITQSERGKA
jgi:hypothetical protein